jgi:signal transduction histidine kinase
LRWGIRSQLLLPLLVLLLALVGTTAYAGVSSAHRAWRRIEEDVRNVAHLFKDVNFTPDQRILGWMKRLSGADYLLVDAREEAPSDPATTLPTATHDLPASVTVVDDWQTLHLGPRVEVGGTTYFCSGIRLRTGSILYVFYPEQQWRDALHDAVLPPLILGVAVLASMGVAVVVAQRLSGRIRELESRTRRIAAGDFDPVPLPPRNDELVDLARSVNEMAGRLAQLQETARQGERLRLLGQVSAGLAHQIRNGVAGARLAVQLHARACRGPADPEALRVALRQLSLVEANLKRFLDMGRTEGLRRERCDLAALIEEAVALLRPQCRHTSVDLRWQAPPETLPLDGDPVRLGHIFLNLLTNAREAAGPDGWVEIVCRRERRTADAAEAVVEVRDSGPGPSGEIAAKLFQPFATGKSEGIGLGLAVAREAATAHGGRLDWSRGERPTCFTVVLPLAVMETKVDPHSQGSVDSVRE